MTTQVVRVTDSKVVVRVTFGAMKSDGNYGHEKAECTIEYQLEDGEDPMSFAATLLEQARRRVHCELGRSPSLAVRRALESPPPRAAVSPAADPDDEDLPEELPY